MCFMCVLALCVGCVHTCARNQCDDDDNDDDKDVISQVLCIMPSDLALK